MLEHFATHWLSGKRNLWCAYGQPRWYLKSHHIAVLAEQQLQQGRSGLLEQLAQVSARAMALQDCFGQLELCQCTAIICLLESPLNVLS